ncbi:MAG: AMP-binding protein [Hoeflea sp.]|uniref:AMP-binding protein n=1 Tax=Hoeflea sp. TaxID=1940281 RepID=UPI0032EF6AD7
MSDLPVVYPSVVHMLSEAAATHPDKEALVCENERLNYGQYAAAVAELADELEGLGVHGDRIAIIMPNSADFAIALFAGLAAGAQTSALNPLYTEHELKEILSDCRPAAIIAASDVMDKVAAAIDGLGLAQPMAVGPGARRLTDPKATRVADGASRLALPDPESLGILQYTGGTTGNPKGVDITHRSTAINVSQRQALVPITGNDRILVMTPLYHVYASSMGLFASVYAGATLVILPKYTPEAALRAIHRERITFFAGSPTIYHGLLASSRMQETDFSQLSLCFSGASALPAETLAEWERRTGSVICEGFGQTETGPVIAANPRDGIRKAGSVGQILPRTEVQIVDAKEGNNVLSPGEIGEIRARGPQMMCGYRNRREETAETLRDGWVYTGDIGFIDNEGYLNIRDRKKDMVIVSGFNVYPREIEEALFGLSGVVEAAVFGVPHQRKGEALHAHVVAPGLTVEKITTHLCERLTRYKLPSHVEIVDMLPKTTIGKVDKVVLRKAALAARNE